jgi:hypothetical protein
MNFKLNVKDNNKILAKAHFKSKYLYIFLLRNNIF